METIQQKLARLSKWKLHNFYMGYPGIAKHLPPTAWFTLSSLRTFLHDYKTVYIKGSTMHTGRGIIKAWKTKGGCRYVQVNGKVHHEASADELFRSIRTRYPKRDYIIQKDINLAKIKGCDFDIRVMMMRDGRRNWQYAGMAAKVAGPGSVVSNVQRGGGYVLSVDQALKHSLGYGRHSIEKTKTQLIHLSRKIMKASDNYPFYSFQCGIDLAVDRKGKIWVIEVNLHNPSHGLFRRLQDKTFFRRVKYLYRSYFKSNRRVI